MSSRGEERTATGRKFPATFFCFNYYCDQLKKKKKKKKKNRLSTQTNKQETNFHPFPF